MNLIKQPNEWSCSLTAFAMCLDAKPESLIAEIGHDGSEVMWPERRRSLKYKGFHLQELYKPCIRRGFAPVWWEREALANSIPSLDGAYVLQFNLAEIINRSFLGVVFNGNHAWAWDGSNLYNPSGRIEEEMISKIMIDNTRNYCQLLKLT